MVMENAGGRKRRWIDAIMLSDATVERFGRWVLRWRWLVIAASIVAALAAGAGAPNLRLSADYRDFFSDANPLLTSFEALQKVYTNDDNLAFVIKPDDGDIFSADFLAAVEGLTEGAWRLPFATRVDSITNFQHSYAEGDDLTVEDLVRNGGELDEAARAAVRDVVFSDPILANRVVSPDGTTTSVSVTVNMANESPTESLEVLDAARVLVTEFNAGYPNARVALTGVVPLNNAFTETGVSDGSTLMPLMFLILIVVMLVLLRSLLATVAALLVVAFSAMAAMGGAGWAGVALNPVTMMAPTIILTIAVADSIHLLVTMLSEMRRGASKSDAIVESLRINFGPVFLTSITTAIGFMTLNFSDAPPFWHLGNITAAGVMAAWLLSIFLLPALISVLPVRVRVRDTQKKTAMDRWAEFVIGNRRVVLGVMVVLVVGLIAMVPRIELNDQFVNYFDESIPFRADADFAMENLPGVYVVNWSLPAAESGGVSDPAYLEKVEGFAEWMRDQDGVTHVLSLTDVFRRLNKNMHGDDEAFYALPEERDLAAQYLLLYEMSLPFGLDLNNQIDVDKSATRLIVTLDNISTAQLRTLDRASDAWLEANFAETVAAGRETAVGSSAVSPFVMFAFISERNINNMLLGSFIAFVLISGILVFALRSPRHGLISLVPNLVPAGMAFGIWSIFVGEVGLAASVVAATSLGIVVDATVHFLSKYLRAYRDRGESAEDAVRYAFSTVGTALWVTTGILIAGFAVLSMSAFKVNSDLGMLTALAIGSALVADFLLLPALLLTVDRKTKLHQETPHGLSQAAA